MGNEAVAWAQACISGAAILISGSIAVFVPWNERRLARRREDQARLDVTCRRSSSGGLELRVQYRPEFHNHALSIGVFLKSPVDARVYKGVRAADGSLGHGSLNDNVRYNSVALLDTEYTSTGDIYSGSLYIDWPDERKGPKSAELKVSVLQHGNHILLEKDLRVSPINEAYWP